jgi:hypothetical protein
MEEVGNTAAWLDYLALAASNARLMRVYKKSTGKTPPEPNQNVPRKELAEPTGDLALYLYWVTLAYWGREGVRQKFFNRAMRYWPKIELPRNVMEL